MTGKRVAGSFTFSLTVIFLFMPTAMPIHADGHIEDTKISRNIEKTVSTNDSAYSDPLEPTTPIPPTDILNLSTDETSSCFPYFISQDVEALLLQASKMLDNARNERQRSWLQLFVRRLQSLLNQLWHLPVKQKSKCFQARDHISNTTNLESAPEDVQLHNAKSLFQVYVEPVRPTHYKEYVTGKVTDIARYRPERHYENALTSKRHPSKLYSPPTGNNFNPSKSMRYTPSVFSKANAEQATHSGIIGYPEPIAYRMRRKPSMDYGSLPFQQISSLKTNPHLVEDRLKFHQPHRNNEYTTQNSETTIVPNLAEDKFGSKSHKPFGKPKIQNVGTMTTPSDDSSIEIEQSTVTTLSYSSSSNTLRKEVLANTVMPIVNAGYQKKINNEYVVDELVQQMHSIAHLPAALAEYPVTDTQLGSTSLPSTPKAVQDIPNEDLTHEAIKFDDIFRNHEMQRLKEVLQHLHGDNPLLLDYDDQGQGAAAGELSSDDEIFGTKNLSFPPTSRVLEHQNGEDAVRQLDALKSMTPETSSANMVSDQGTTLVRNDLPVDKHK